MKNARERTPPICAIVVSYNTEKVTLKCIQSVLQSEGIDVDVYVVDNGSSDDTVHEIQKRYSQVNVVALNYNHGYGNAINAVWNGSEYEFYLFLNSDCFVFPDTIFRCFWILKQHPNAGAMSCQLLNADNSIQLSCRRFPTVVDEFFRAIVPPKILKRLGQIGRYLVSDWNHTGTRKVDQPAGSYLLVKREAWGEGLPFDPIFFMYYEDVDICKRIWNNGYSIWFTDKAKAMHLNEHSFSNNRDAMSRAMTKSRAYYYFKWHGIVAAYIVIIINICGSLLRSLVWGFLSMVDYRNSVALARTKSHAVAALEGIRLLFNFRAINGKSIFV